MALKPTIFKVQLQLADSDRHHYQDYALTMAQHPSETLERMLVRLLAFALHASDQLEFTKGISTSDEPDLWAHSDDGVLQLWVEVGQPKPDRIKKALTIAKQVALYTFAKTCDTWWSIEGANIPLSDRLIVRKLPWASLQQLAANVGRNIQWHVSIAGGEVYVDDGKQTLTISPQNLRP